MNPDNQRISVVVYECRLVKSAVSAGSGVKTQLVHSDHKHAHKMVLERRNGEGIGPVCLRRRPSNQAQIRYPAQRSSAEELPTLLSECPVQQVPNRSKCGRRSDSWVSS